MDKTRQIVQSYDIDVYKADDILPHLEKYKGKAENLWKALFVTRGEIIVYIDADIKNIHHRNIGINSERTVQNRFRLSFRQKGAGHF